MSAHPPLDLDALRSALAAPADGGPAGGGPPYPVGISRVSDGPGALGELADVIASLGGAAGDVVILAAATPMTVSGAGLRAAVLELAGSRGTVRWVVLGPASGSVHADEQTVRAARSAAAGARCVVTVGSGTISDIGKAAAAPGTPLVAVQTAASVNGYADPFSVLLRAGVKRTTPTRWPDALIIDTDVLRDAPADLNTAGLGDMAAMFTATADWYLASLLRADGPPYLPAVAGLVRPHGERMLSQAGHLRSGPGHLADLARLLTLSGIGMGVAGSTAPASGMEHAVSHLLEMAATATGGASSLHGAQVGVAAITAAATWAHVRERISAGGLDQAARLPGPDVIGDQIGAAFAHLDPSGAMAAECLADYASKIRLLASGADPLATLRAAWADHDAALGQLLTDPRTLAAALASAGLPVSFGDLPAPVDDREARWAVASCALQRRRLGVADLAMMMGAWEPADVDAVLSVAQSAASLAAGGDLDRGTPGPPAGRPS